MAFAFIGHGGIINSHFFPSGEMDGRWSDLIHQLIDQAGIGKGASGHDFVIASSSAIGVEVFMLNAFLA